MDLQLKLGLDETARYLICNGLDGVVQLVGADSRRRQRRGRPTREEQTATVKIATIEITTVEIRPASTDSTYAAAVATQWITNSSSAWTRQCATCSATTWTQK